MSMRNFHYLLLCLFLLLLCDGCATSKTSSATPVVQSAESSFLAGEVLYAGKHYEEAIAQWRKVKESFYSPELTSLAELKIADALYADEKYIEAAAEYENFRKLHPNHEKSAYALYRLGLCNFKQITGIDVDQTPVKNAVSYLETFLKLYPASEYAVDVRDTLDICRTKMNQYEIYVGRFYLRTENYQSAINRLEGTLKRFPKSTANDEALLYLGEAYTLYGDKIKGKDSFDRLAKDFPSSPALKDARKFIKKYY